MTRTHEILLELLQRPQGVTTSEIYAAVPNSRDTPRRFRELHTEFGYNYEKEYLSRFEVRYFLL